MDRRDFLRTVGVGTVAALLSAGLERRLRAQSLPAASAPARRAGTPNIICILADDVGLGDIGCYGGKYKTPRIDALAAAGVRFERCYSTPLCGPSRCQLLTGQYPFRTGLINNSSDDAISPQKQIMIPAVLKKAGYATTSVGKWGQMALGPGDWGFDDYLTFNGSGRYWGHQGKYRENGRTRALPENGYLPDVMHQHLVDFVAHHRDGPFFAYYPLSHVHKPILRTPDSKPGSPDLYADNVAYMDKLVGELVDELKRLQLEDNTLVIFVGDNGSAQTTREGGNTINGKPIHGAKGSMMEGGARVPLIAYWPGHVPAGRTNSDLIDFTDFFPTFAELGGASMPKDRPMDGHSFAAQLVGKKGEPREWVYVELDGRRYVRNERWKLTGAEELYDLKDAPFSEVLVAANSSDADAQAARKSLHAALVGLVGEERLGGPAGLVKPARARRQRRRGANEASTTKPAE
jgi:arylsulfatase A